MSLSISERTDPPCLFLMIEDIILSAGGSPKIPRVLASLQPRPWTEESVLTIPVLHTASYITCIPPVLANLAKLEKPLKIAIVGSGQSSAECLMDIYNRLEGFPVGGHQIDMIIRKGSLKPSDDSPFVNEIFDPSSKYCYAILSKIQF